MDDPVAPLHAEVHVKVRHGHPFRVEEALKQQVVLHGVDVGDEQRVGHQRAGAGTTPRPHRHAVVLGPLDEVHHDQEVAWEPHLVDDVELEIQAFVIARPLLLVLRVRAVQDAFQPRFQPFLGDLAEVLFHGHPFRDGILGQRDLAQPDRNRAPARDLEGVVDRLRDVLEQLDHLLLGTEVLLLAEAPLAARVIQRLALADADPGLVGLEVVGLKEVDVVGGHHREFQRLGQGHLAVQAVLVVGAAGALELEIEGAGEKAGPVARPFLGQPFLAGQDGAANIPFPGTGEHEQPFRPLFDPFPLHHRYAGCQAIGVAQGNDLGEVAEAGLVTRQQGDAEGLVGILGIAQPDVRANDRLDAGAGGALVELHQRAHVGLFGQPDGGHAHFRRAFDQWLDPDQAIDQGILRMDAKMNECARHRATP